jgi:hypothetical protein
MVAVSAPEPRVTFSRFEKAMDPRVPAFAAETLRVSAVVVDVRESVPSPVLRVREVELLLTVMESSPARVLIVSKLEIAVPSTVPTAEALMVRLLLEALVLRVSEPAPALRDEREAPVAMVAVSAPEPRVTFSRFEKAMDPRVPAFAVETLRVSAVVVDVRESVPSPVLRVRAVALLLTVMESSPARVLIVSKLEIAVPSTVPTAEALMVRLLLEALVLRVSEPAPALREVSEPPAAIVAVSFVELRVTFSRFVKVVELSRVPELVPDTLRVPL